MEFGRRRGLVLSLLDDSRAALILPAAPELHVGADGELRYQPDPDLYYLTGCTEPEAVLVLAPAAATPFTLFVRDRDPERERWTGARRGVAGARDAFGADVAYQIGELNTRLPELVGGADVLFARLQSGRPEIDAALLAVLASARRSRVRTGRGPHTVVSPDQLLGPLRLRKDEHEIARIREAARISVEAFRLAAAGLVSARGEWEIEAVIEHAFRSSGATGPAFPSIVAAGANATVLHYTSNSDELPPEALLLIDAGARYRMYCADITRTLPVTGRFTAAQRAAYDVVLRARNAALERISTSHTAADLHDAAVGALVDGMLELGLLSGSRDEILEKETYRRFFPHRTSHWLGLDVHDVGDYVDRDGKDVRLEAGMVLTVEPGLYVPVDDEDAPAELRGLGIRLEDDVLVTDAAADVLTGDLAIRPDDVEALLCG
jgi:Xaa-Pro aminopeptidase